MQIVESSKRMGVPVVVYPDRETGDINITLAVRSLHSVAGTVRKESDGHPVAGATVRLTRKAGEDQAFRY